MFAEIFKYEDGNLINIKTGHIYCNKDRDGYIRVRVLGREFRAHRIIWELHNGPIPTDILIDHIDGDVSNNYIDNLRTATRQQNNANSSKVSTKKSLLPKGITLNPSGKYRARLTHKGNTYSIGTFNTVEEAKKAYDKLAVELNGEFANDR